ncbi:hypothetical protein BGX31_001017 [Mortierella sp. GBA43]|nr:hypothetical protein BGX31_001017 [Mortierella sp. GBA43]
MYAQPRRTTQVALVGNSETSRPTHPLEIPEILRLIASYVMYQDLPSCLCVSKAWKHSFLPFRWRVIKAAYMNTRPIGPREVDIIHHRHFIVELTLCGDPAGLDKCNYPNLQRLTIDRNSNAIYPVAQRVVRDPIDDQTRTIDLDFTEIFPSLITLKLTGVGVSALSWSTLSAHLHLRKLNLHYIEVEANDMPSFWGTCAHLETLELIRVSISDTEEDIPSSAVFDRMRRLFVLGNQYPYLTLRCPNLNDLYWGSAWTSLAPTSIDRSVPKGAWPRLTRLTIGVNVVDMDIASMLEGAGGADGSLVHFQLDECRLQTQSFRALSLHFSTLTYLAFDHSPLSMSRIIRDVMCCCPNLHDLIAGVVLATDITAGGPWVCSLLQELRICFWFREHEQDLQQLVFERLSTLTDLQRLTLYHPDNEEIVESHDVLEFRLERGLGQLASLQNLEFLEFDKYGLDPYEAGLGMEEVTWMHGNWKSLKRIDGIPHDDELIRELQFHGIEST